LLGGVNAQSLQKSGPAASRKRNGLKHLPKMCWGPSTIPQKNLGKKKSRKGGGSLNKTTSELKKKPQAKKKK